MDASVLPQIIVRYAGASNKRICIEGVPEGVYAFFGILSLWINNDGAFMYGKKP